MAQNPDRFVNTSSSGGGGSGDASAANQTTQISLETAIRDAVQIMDDWDESDRAKVNPIAGQVGVQGGSGVVTALTQRTVPATDVPARVIPLGKRMADPADGSSIEVKYAKSVVSADTADFIAGVTGKKILVVEAVVQKQADNTNIVTMKFNNSVANTLIAGAPEVTMKNAADGAVLPFSPGGWFVTVADGEGIDLDITAAESVMVMLGYVEID